MVQPSVHEFEKERLEELDAYEVLDTLPEDDYDDLTSIAAEICDTRISLVSLIDKDRQWFKSKFGLGANETPREHAFCAHAINEPHELFMVNDASKDERFHDNPLVTGNPNVAFYAGVPLVNENGFALGTLCVIDDTPKTLTERQQKALKALGRQIMNILELRRKRKELVSANQSLKLSNEELVRFSSMVAHDVKGPLTGINELIKVLEKEDYLKEESQEAKDLVNVISKASGQLRHLVDQLLEYGKSIHLGDIPIEDISIDELENHTLDLFNSFKNLQITFHSSIDSIKSNKSAIERILLNLVNNSIKYNDKSTTEIDISFEEDDKHYSISIADNGPGIPEEQHDKIFEIFQVLNVKDEKGTGLGLAIVRRLIDSTQGSIQVDSLEDGIKFTIQIPK